MIEKKLVSLKNSSYVFTGPTNIGIIEDADGVFLIDSGCDDQAGKDALEFLEKKGWRLKAIVNTHSNADHMGGNAYLQSATGCEVWATREEAAFVENPFMEECMFWGGYPFRELRSKFYAASPSRVARIIESGSRAGRMEFIPLPGHFFNMTGVLTDDGVFYVADAVYDEYVLGKLKIPYILDVPAFRSTLYKLKNIRADFYVPSHGKILTDIGGTVNYNIFRIDEIEEALLNILKKKMSFDDIAAALCNAFEISPTYSQFIVMCSTIRSYLSYLYDSGRIVHSMRDNKMLWEAAPGNA